MKKTRYIKKEGKIDIIANFRTYIEVWKMDKEL